MGKSGSSRRTRHKEIDAAVEMARINRDDHIYRDLIKYVGYAIIAVFVWLSIKELAGTVTVADIKVMVGEMGNCPSWKLIGVSLVFGAFGIVYGRRQRQLRGDAIENLHPYQKLWETAQDPERTSSSITKRGETRPEDV